MAKVNFTAARISSFSCPPNVKQAFLWDSKSPGLGLRATAAGAKSYIFQSKLNNGSVRLTIGDVKSWTIDKAQERARHFQTLVDSGVDPREHLAEQQVAMDARRKEALRQDALLGEVWDVYIELRKPFWSERHYRDHIKHADAGGQQRKRGKGLTQPGPLAALRTLKLSSLSGERISGWLVDESAKRPTMVALSFRLLRSFIRWADDQALYKGLIPHEAYKARDVKDALPRVRAKEGDALQREQLAAWFSAVCKIGNLVTSVYLQGLLITGARREEWASVQWSDIDFTWRSITLNDKVEGSGGRTIPLTPYLSSLLLELKRQSEIPPSKRALDRMREYGEKWSPSPWVFHSPTSADGKIAEPRIAHVKALKAAGLPHITLHGLRRSFGTLSEWCEVPVGVVAQIQGHKPSAIAEKHYRRRPIDLLRMWHDKIEAWILEQADVSFEPMKKK